MNLSYREWSSMALSYYHHDCRYNDPNDCPNCSKCLKDSELPYLVHGAEPDSPLSFIKEGLAGKRVMVFQYDQAIAVRFDTRSD